MEPKNETIDDVSTDGATNNEPTEPNEIHESGADVSLEKPTESTVVPEDTARRVSIAEAIQSGKAISGRSLTMATAEETPDTVAAPVPAMKTRRMKKMLLYIAGGVFGVFALALLAGVIFKDDRVGSLVQSQAKGVAFVRPEKWVEKTSDDGFVYYTENGLDIQAAEMAVVLGEQASPVEYASLSEDDKSRVKGAFTARPEALSGSFSNDCEQPGQVVNNELQRDGYDLAYLIEATCEKLKNRDSKGMVKIVFGWKGKSLQIFAVMADEQLWQQNQKKLDQIISSAKPL